MNIWGEHVLLRQKEVSSESDNWSLSAERNGLHQERWMEISGMGRRNCMYEDANTRACLTGK